MVRISRPWLLPAFAASAVLFWSWVGFWLFFHSTVRCHPPALRLAEPPPYQVPVEVVVAPAPTPGVAAPAQPPEWALRQALATALPAIRAQARHLPREGRLEVRARITSRGRVSEVSVDPGDQKLSPAGRRAIERALERTTFPQLAAEYQIDFPLVIQNQHD